MRQIRVLVVGDPLDAKLTQGIIEALERAQNSGSKKTTYTYSVSTVIVLGQGTQLITELGYLGKLERKESNGWKDRTNRKDIRLSRSKKLKRRIGVS